MQGPLVVNIVFWCLLLYVCTRVLQLSRLLQIFFYLVQNRSLPKKKIKNTKFEKKKFRFRGRTEAFFTEDLVFARFGAARWCYVKSLLLMSHCKIERLFLVFYIKKKFSTTSKTVYIYVFFSELIAVKIDRVYVRRNYNRNSI